MTLKEHIVSKFTSGRWIQSVAFTLTYCIGIIGALILTIMDKMKLETFLVLWSGFTGMVLLINEWYFKREDRAKENGAPK
jgi:hypothetical protein